MNITQDEIEEITYALKHYLAQEYHCATNFAEVIKNRVEVNTNLFRYNCTVQTIYLTAENYAVSYDKQHIIDNMYYYDFNTGTAEDTAGTYTYINTYEWKRGSIYES